jgi:hypothetical protein
MSILPPKMREFKTPMAMVYQRVHDIAWKEETTMYES